MSQFSWSERNFPDYGWSTRIKDVGFEDFWDDIETAEKHAYHLQDALDIHKRIIDENMHEEGYEDEVINYLQDVGYEEGFEDLLRPARWLTEQIALEAWNLKDANPTGFPISPEALAEEVLEDKDRDKIQKFRDVTGLDAGNEVVGDKREALLSKKDYLERTNSRALDTGYEWAERGRIGRLLTRVGVFDSSHRTWPSEGYTRDLSPSLKHWELQEE